MQSELCRAQDEFWKWTRPALFQLHVFIIWPLVSYLFSFGFLVDFLDVSGL